MDDFDEDELCLIDEMLEQDRASNSISKTSFLFDQNSKSNNDTIRSSTNQTTTNIKPQVLDTVVPLESFAFSMSNRKNSLSRSNTDDSIKTPLLFGNSKSNENTACSLPARMPDKRKEVQEKSIKKKGTPLAAQSRIEEYMKSAEKEKQQRPDFSEMTTQQIIEYFKDHETKIGSNSGLPPKLEVDSETIQTWVYLLTKSFREYQFKIVETCLFYNTLACLPTGLGKTFIAANVMLNYYRWFPRGKIFFLAPTKPLVNQQKDAIECLKSVNSDDIIEITGKVPTKKRSAYYYEKRMFFMTPQTLEHDLEKSVLNAKDVVLVVVDEAHRALGKYSYTNIIKLLDEAEVGYRILALTATPGNNEEKIQEVLTNLNIARLEVKDENDEDVRPYVKNKDIREIIIKNSTAMDALHSLFNEILMKPIRTLQNMKLFPDNPKLTINKPHEITRTKMLQMMEEFKKDEEEITLRIGFENKSLFYEIIGIVTNLCQAKQILQEQGIGSFMQYFENFKTTLKNKYGFSLEYKKRLINSPEFKRLEECIKDVEKNGQNHPKLEKLHEILTCFFNDPKTIQNQSRCMIFTNNRASANEINEYLQKADKVRSSVFVGQSSYKSKTGKPVIEGINQKKQIEIIQKFKDYELNTLVATCIGEEGLDIGEIDLIICYDSGFSPIRLVQRMGRTGRKRAGKVLILLMEGKEYYSYRASVKRSQNLKNGLKANSTTKSGQKSLVARAKSNFRFYSFSPRMIPDEITPKLVLINDINEKKLQELQERQDAQVEAEGEEEEEEKQETEKALFDTEENSITNFIKDEIEETKADTKFSVEIAETVEIDDDLEDISQLLEEYENEQRRSNTIQSAIVEERPSMRSLKDILNGTKTSFSVDERPSQSGNPFKRRFGDQKGDGDGLFQEKQMKVFYNQRESPIVLSQDSNY